MSQVCVCYIRSAVLFCLSDLHFLSFNSFSTFTTKMHIALSMEVFLLYFSSPSPFFPSLRKDADLEFVIGRRDTIYLHLHFAQTAWLLHMYTSISLHMADQLLTRLKIIFMLEGCRAFTISISSFTSAHSPCLKFPTLPGAEPGLGLANTVEDGSSLSTDCGSGEWSKGYFNYWRIFLSLRLAWAT